MVTWKLVLNYLKMHNFFLMHPSFLRGKNVRCPAHLNAFRRFWCFKIVLFLNFLFQCHENLIGKNSETMDRRREKRRWLHRSSFSRLKQPRRSCRTTCIKWKSEYGFAKRQFTNRSPFGGRKTTHSNRQGKSLK